MDTLAKRFIDAYNKIDYALRTVYKQKRSLTFSDAVRKSVSQNSVIRKYEDDLIDYGRLRNAIVHSHNPNVVMAEPHEDIVEKIEKIAEIVSEPPRVVSVVRKNVEGVEGKQSVKDVIIFAQERGYSNIPVYENEAIIGVANLNLLTRGLGLLLKSGVSIDEYFEKTQIKDVIEKMKELPYYTIKSEKCTVEEALDAFYNNRKLTCIIITKNGNFLEKPIGIVTSADIIDLNDVIEDY